jgi:hypothetical protein
MSAAALTARLRVVQPRAMVRVKVNYLVGRKNADGTMRWYFMPRWKHRSHGWAAVRLHDEYERPITDELKAAEAARAIGDIYSRWAKGEAGYGPHRIDKLGRVVTDTPKKRRAAASATLYRPGQIGAMVQDFLDHDLFKELGAKTQLEYRTYLGHFVDGRAKPDDPTFGETDWQQLAPGKVRAWLMAWSLANGPAGAHSLYRTARAFFGKIRLCYDSVGHPGFVADHLNPLRKLDLSLPRGALLVWPRAAVDAFVALADAEGQPSIGDAVVTMSWLGVRRQDWLGWGHDFFERDLLAFRQEKTGAPNVLPWNIIPALVERVEAAKKRRTTDAVTATTFYHDSQGRPWKDAETFRKSFNAIRAKLAAAHPSFPTRHYVGLLPDPLAVPTAQLTMRTMRHTCVTFNFDAGIPPELIGGITGHTTEEINDILRHYRANTADQAQAAIELRLAHEAKKGAK